MKNKSFRSKTGLCMILLCGILLVGCGSGDSPTATPQESPAVTEAATPVPTEAPVETSAPSEPIPASTAAVENAVATKTLIISAVNMSDVSVGMFAVIDPVTGEQMNIDGLEPGKSIKLETNWPIDTTNFQWALYNTSGELCIDAATDISDAQSAVALILTGTGNIENVEVVSE